MTYPPPKDIKRIVYSDAHYSYSNNLEIPKSRIVFYGRIICETDKYINYEIAWTNKPHKTIFGIVIPRDLIVGNRINKKKIAKNINSVIGINTSEAKVNIGDTIAIYWNDIFVYNEEYGGEQKTTPMLTEGILQKETESYILVRNPETLNLSITANHPSKRPFLYYIPKAMISEIKLVKKYEKTV